MQWRHNGGGSALFTEEATLDRYRAQPDIQRLVVVVTDGASSNQEQLNRSLADFAALEADGMPVQRVVQSLGITSTASRASLGPATPDCVAIPDLVAMHTRCDAPCLAPARTGC